MSAFDGIKAKFKSWYGKTYEEVKEEAHTVRDKETTVKFGTAFWVAVGIGLLCFFAGALTHWG